MLYYFLKYYYMNMIWTIIAFFFINMSGCILHFYKFKKLKSREIIRRERFMTNFYLTIFFNVIMVSLIGIFVFTIFLEKFIYSFSIVPFLLDTIFILIINDTWFYWFHRLLHTNKKLRSIIHHEHHLSIKPLPMDYIYAHPLEVLGGLIGIIIPLFLKSVNIYSYMLAVLIRNIHEIEIHSTCRNKSIIPFFNSPKKHYIHHSLGRSCNYSSMFSFWDKLMNTEQYS